MASSALDRLQVWLLLKQKFSFDKVVSLHTDNVTVPILLNRETAAAMDQHAKGTPGFNLLHSGKQNQGHQECFVDLLIQVLLNTY